MLWLDLPDNVDFIMKSIVIPALPAMIDSAVAWFNSQGYFKGE